MPHSSIVSGYHKVLHFYERPDISMLFNLAWDLGETRNIAKEYPDKHRELHYAMIRHFIEVGGRIPKPNPDYDSDIYRQADEYQRRVMWGPFEGQRPPAADEK